MINRKQKKTIKFILSLMIFFIISISVFSNDAKNFVISSFSTAVDDQSPNAKKNIFLGCERVSNYLLPAHAIFSFNRVVGEGSATNGFVEGGVLYRDNIKMEPGGGLCQVSSTLYNAFLLAGFKIVERHRHYQPVTYVPLGLDATIKFGKKDLKIKNPYNFPLTIKSEINEKSITFIITAKNKIPYKYEIATEEEEIKTPFADEQNEVRNGIAVYVYRKKYTLKGKFLQSFLLYKDYYPPVVYRR